MEDRSQYLGLAQLSQSVIRNVLLYLERGEWETLKRSVSVVLPSLEALSSEGSPAAQSSAFASYEQLSTISEAWDKAETERVIDHLKKLMNAGDGPEARREAEGLIAPFQRLSTQALWNFEQPEAMLPAGILELCRAH